MTTGPVIKVIIRFKAATTLSIATLNLTALRMKFSTNKISDFQLIGITCNT
jgi:hypothetical protein